MRTQPIANNSSDSGSEVYGVSRTSLRKLNANLESCSSIDSLTSNARIGQARHLVEQDIETSGFYHQPYDQTGVGQMNNNNKLNTNLFQPLKPEIVRITNSSSQSTNNSPIQARNSRFLNMNNSFRTASSFIGSQNDDESQLTKPKCQFTNLGARQKSESNLIGNTKFSILCNPIDEFNVHYAKHPENDYNTFDNQLEIKMNKIKKYYQTTKSMNSDQLKTLLSSTQQANCTSKNPNQETQSLIGIYDLVSEETNN